MVYDLISHILLSMLAYNDFVALPILSFCNVISSGQLASITTQHQNELKL